MSEQALPEFLRQPMVERVARAICQAAGYDPNREEMDACGDGRLNWENWTDEAVAAIFAMREPNLAMRKACSFEVAEITWPAMIEAALAKASQNQTGG